MAYLMSHSKVMEQGCSTQKNSFCRSSNDFFGKNVSRIEYCFSQHKRDKVKLKKHSEAMLVGEVVRSMQNGTDSSHSPACGLRRSRGTVAGNHGCQCRAAHFLGSCSCSRRSWSRTIGLRRKKSSKGCCKQFKTDASIAHRAGILLGDC